MPPFSIEYKKNVKNFNPITRYNKFLPLQICFRQQNILNYILKKSCGLKKKNNPNYPTNVINGIYFWDNYYNDFFSRKMDTYKQKEPNRFSKTINKKKQKTKEIIANPQTYKNI